VVVIHPARVSPFSLGRQRYTIAHHGSNFFLPLGHCSRFLAVAIGAFGAHALQASFGQGLAEVYEDRRCATSSTNALAPSSRLPTPIGRWPESSGRRWAGLALHRPASSLFFRGASNALSLTGIKVLGAITPLGGVFLFSAGWAILGMDPSWRG